jgi:hypothetical protein
MGTRMVGPVQLRLQSYLFQYGELVIIFMSSTDVLKDLFLIQLEYFYRHRLPSMLIRWLYTAFATHIYWSSLQSIVLCISQGPARCNHLQRSVSSVYWGRCALCYRLSLCELVRMWAICWGFQYLAEHSYLPNTGYLFYKARVFQTGIVFTVCYHNILYTSILTDTMPY